MKKLFAALLLMAVLVSLTACNTEQKVTIYIPVKETEYTEENGQPASIQYLLYEDDWQTKESFTVSYSTDGKTPSTNGKILRYEDKHITTADEYVQIEKYMDEYGNVNSITELQKQNSLLTQTMRTFDEHGRILSQVQSSGVRGGSETYFPQVSFNITETEQGSESAGTQYGVTETYVYDKDYRVVRYIKSFYGAEETREEYTYDKHGNRTSVTYYTEGNFVSKTVIEYEAAQVGISAANRLLCFKREN